MTITHQKQPTKTSCGQTVVAMLTGIPVKDIAELYGHRTTTYFHDHKRVLNALGYKVEEVKGGFTCLEDLPPVAMIRVSRLKKSSLSESGYSKHPKRQGHAILWAEGKFWDPAGGVYEDALPLQSNGRVITHVRAVTKES